MQRELLIGSCGWKWRDEGVFVTSKGTGVEGLERIETDTTDRQLDRRSLVKTAVAGATAVGLAALAPSDTSATARAFVPNNFHAVIHVTNPDGMPYAFSALQTIADHYDKATGRLIIDGTAVAMLATEDGLASLETAEKAGAEIVAARDALQINGIDPDSLPDFIDADDPGIIAVVDAQVKGFHYYKL